MRNEYIISALIAVIVSVVVVLGYLALAPTPDPEREHHWVSIDLHLYEIAPRTVEVDGTLLNLKGDAENVQIRCFVNTTLNNTWYGQSYIGFVKEGTSVDFVVLITCTEPIVAYGVDKVIWW